MLELKCQENEDLILSQQEPCWDESANPSILPWKRTWCNANLPNISEENLKEIKWELMYHWYHGYFLNY